MTPSRFGSDVYSRWVPALAMTLVAIISYIDRNTLALLAPTIMREAQLTNQQYGFLISAFALAYMVSNPIWGRIIDRVGVRWGMTAAVAIWTAASVSHAFAAGFVGFALARFVLGLGEGATSPGSLRTVVQTLPPSLRARGVAVAYGGGSLGAIVTPLIITPIVVLWGWRAGFWFTGLIGLAWLIMWAFLSRRPDLEHTPPENEALAPSKWLSTPILAFVAADALGAFPSSMVNFFAANYLHSVLGKTQIEIGRVLWIPPLGWEVGYFFWGWISDRFTRAGSSISALRRQFLCLTLLSLPIALIPRIGAYTVVLLMLFYVMFLSAGFIITATTYRMNVWPGHAGLLGGLGAASSAFVVALTMPVVGRLFDLKRFDETFLLATLFPVVGFVVWNYLNSGARLLKPAVPT